MKCRLCFGLVAIAFLQACSTTSDPEANSTTIVEDSPEISCKERARLFPQHARVTELYISNLRRRLTYLEEEAKCCAPYNSDPNAPLLKESVSKEIQELTETIKRHQSCLPEQLPNLEPELIADTRL